MGPAYDNGYAEERRAMVRRRVLLKGKLASADAALSWDCVIRNLSPSGVQLALDAGEILPTPVYFINTRDGSAHEAHVAWVSGDRLGLAFDRAVDLADDVGPAASHLRRLWRASAPRVCGAMA